MHLNITIDNTSTTGELLALSAFVEQLADERAPATVSGNSAATVTSTDAKPEPARRTRGKNRNTEAAAPAPTEAAAPAPTEAAAPAPTEAAEPAAPGKTSTEEWDAAKTYTEADVQALATLVARAHGPDVVKEKIAELGGARIADLDAAKLNALGAFLETKKQ